MRKDDLSTTTYPNINPPPRTIIYYNFTPKRVGLSSDVSTLPVRDRGEDKAVKKTFGFEREKQNKCVEKTKLV